MCRRVVGLELKGVLAWKAKEKVLPRQFVLGVWLFISSLFLPLPFHTWGCHLLLLQSLLAVYAELIFKQILQMHSDKGRTESPHNFCASFLASPEKAGVSDSHSYKIWDCQCHCHENTVLDPQRELIHNTPSHGLPRWCSVKNLLASARGSRELGLIPGLGRSPGGGSSNLPHNSTLAWKIPRTEEPGEIQSRGSQRVRHDCFHTHTPKHDSYSL